MVKLDLDLKAYETMKCDKLIEPRQVELSDEEIKIIITIKIFKRFMSNREPSGEDRCWSGREYDIKVWKNSY